jgi:hypothetical protein
MSRDQHRSHIGAFLGLGSAFVVAPLLAWLTDGGLQLPWISPVLLLILCVGASLLAARGLLGRIGLAVAFFAVAICMFFASSLGVNGGL